MSNTILVIEDERITRSSLEDFLKSEGFKVLSAENGRIGIELAQKYLPDLVICDIMMPELDGYDVLLNLQSNPVTSVIPFIFLTVAADEVGHQQSLEMGADDYLSKPITSERLRVAIANQLAKKESYKTQKSANFDDSNFLKQITTNKLSPSLPSSEASHLTYLKDRLIEEFCQGILNKVINLNQKVEIVLTEFTELQNNSNIKEIRTDLMTLLRLTNQVSALNKSLNTDNASELIEEFLVSISKLNNN